MKIRVPWIAVPDGGELMVITCEDVSLDSLGIDATIPRGFRCDGMSIPELFRPAMGEPVDAIATSAAVVHDYLYSRPTRTISGEQTTRADADAILRDMLIDAGYGRIKSWLAWASVRMFGGSHWHDEELVV